MKCAYAPKSVNDCEQCLYNNICEIYVEVSDMEDENDFISDEYR